MNKITLNPVSNLLLNMLYYLVSMLTCLLFSISISFSQGNPPCKPAKIKGATKVQPGIPYQYKHNFDTCNLKQIEWEIWGAISCDGILINSKDTVISTKVEVEIVWDSISKTGRLKTRPVDPCGFQAMCGNAPAVLEVGKIWCTPEITGDKTPCKGLTYTYHYTLDCGSGNVYDWIVFGAAEINGNPVSTGRQEVTDNSHIDIKWANVPSARLYCFPQNACGFLGLCGHHPTNIFLDIKGGTPLGSISGLTTFGCEEFASGHGETLFYSIPVSPYAYEYFWIMDPCWQIVSDNPLSNSIALQTCHDGSGTIGSLVRYSCGTNNENIPIIFNVQYLTLTATIADPGPITYTGPNCKNGTNTFITEGNLHFSGQIEWELRDPVTGNPSTAFFTINNNWHYELMTLFFIEVNFNGVSSVLIRVRETHPDCENSGWTSLLVNTLDIPAPPGPILNHCSEEMCYGNPVLFFTSPVPNAVSYIWTVDDGNIAPGPGMPDINGTSVNITLESAASLVTVSVNNGCGISQPSILAIEDLTNPLATPIIVLPVEYCSKKFHYFEIANLGSEVIYNWSVNADLPIISTTGQKTDRFGVKFQPGTTTFTIQVGVNRDCCSSLSNLITVNPVFDVDCSNAPDPQNNQQRIGLFGSNNNIDEFINLEEEINIFPNPANEYIILHLTPDDHISYIKLTDIQGRLILESSSKAAFKKIDISGLSAGFYIMSITHNEQTVREKIIISRK